MMEKRERKMGGIVRDFASVLRYGDPNRRSGSSVGFHRGTAQGGGRDRMQQGIKAGGLVRG